MVTSAPIGRRRLLRLLAGASVIGGAIAGCAVRTADRVASATASFREALPLPKRSLPPLPVDPAIRVEGLSPLVTPTADFFRIDVAEEVPIPSTSAWRLRIDGMVRNPMDLGYDELLDRGLVEVDASIACVSNSVGGFLVGNARWLGVPLDALIDEAGPLRRADQVMGHSVDGFTAGFPVAALADRDAIVAVGMNGQPLEPEHGYPARIIVPGLYGYVSAVKWLSRIELTRFDEQVGYWISRGWSRLAPVKLASRIDTPRPFAPVQAGARAIGGVAWAATSGISRVEVRIDAQPWQEAQLGPELSSTSWRQWWLTWDAQPGSHTISVRAWDGDGRLQSSKDVPPVPDGAEGLHRITVTVE